MWVRSSEEPSLSTREHFCPSAASVHTCPQSKWRPLLTTWVFSSKVFFVLFLTLLLYRSSLDFVGSVRWTHRRFWPKGCAGSLPTADSGSTLTKQRCCFSVSGAHSHCSLCSLLTQDFIESDLPKSVELLRCLTEQVRPLTPGSRSHVCVLWTLCCHVLLCSGGFSHCSCPTAAQPGGRWSSSHIQGELHNIKSPTMLFLLCGCHEQLRL